MPVKIRKMTNGEFEIFYRWSVEQHIKELTEGLHMSAEEATRETVAEVAGMLPDGLNTEGSDLMTVVAENESVGFIWTVYEETEGRKQCFICDFAIWELKRSKGYAQAALHLAEKNAATAGCREIVLFVREDNVAAGALYKKCGYQILRKAGYGAYMIKQLA